MDKDDGNCKSLFWVSTELKCYVYRLIDPRNGTTFYVGRGRGNRVFAHVGARLDPGDSNEDTDLKLGTIRAIRNAGFDVQHVIHRHGMDEKTAAEVEAALIDAYPGLTNLAKGRGSDRGIMHADEIVRKFEAKPAIFAEPVLLINVNRYTEEQDLYDAVRFAWKISAKKAREAKYILAVRKGLIIGAFEAQEWLPATPKNFSALCSSFPETDPKRWGFRGREAPERVRRQYVGKRAPTQKQGAAFPIRYQSPTSIAAAE